MRGAKLGMMQELLSLDGDEHAEALTELIVEKKVTTKSEVRRIVRQMKSFGGSKGEKRNLLAEQQPFSYYYSVREVRQHVLDRAFSKFIASLKVCMIRLDEVLGSLDENDEWVVRETLMQCRRSIHNQIDSLIILKMRTQHLLELTPSV